MGVGLSYILAHQPKFLDNFRRRMDSPVIKDDWIAIKEFPLLSGKALKALEAQTGSLCIGDFNAHNGNVLQDGTSIDEVDRQKFNIKWIEDLNVVQLIYFAENESCPLQLQGEDQEFGYKNCDEDVPAEESQQYLSAELTVEKISNIHEQICLICETLSGRLPELPVVPKGY